MDEWTYCATTLLKPKKFSKPRKPTTQGGQDAIFSKIITPFGPN
jgi:hypothetical protein